MFTKKDRTIKNQRKMIENRNELIKNMEEKENIRDAKIKVLEYEKLKLMNFQDKVVNIMNGDGSIVDKHDKIKELVDDLATENKLKKTHI